MLFCIGMVCDYRSVPLAIRARMMILHASHATSNGAKKVGPGWTRNMQAGYGVFAVIYAYYKLHPYVVGSKMLLQLAIWPPVSIQPNEEHSAPARQGAFRSSRT